MFDCSPVSLETDRLVLTMPPPSAAPVVAAYFERNRRHHEPWDPPRPEGFTTAAHWASCLEKSREDFAEGRAMRLFLFPRGGAAHTDAVAAQEPTRVGRVEPEGSRKSEDRPDGRSERSRQPAVADAAGPPVIGVCNFTNIVRGPLQACILGYSLDHAAVGRGLMTEALRRAIAHAFDDLGLHRIHANHLPENERSARLLARLGFVREGYARNYLFINGAWRDHVLTALVNPRPMTPTV